MHWLDWLIIVAYLVYIIYDGIRLTRRSTGIEGYFLANRSLPWWAVGLSVMATQLSAITLVGTTGQAFDDGMRFIQFYFGLPLAMIILCVTVVPFFYRAKVYTAYEFLEKRFDVRTRTMTSFFFLLSRGLSCGVIIAAPSIILSIVFGWDRLTTILTMGLATTIYTMFGGVQAVTWTDVKQMVIIFIGLGAVLVVVLYELGHMPVPEAPSFTEALSLAGAAGRLKTVDTHFDLNETYTLWSGLIGGLFLMLSYFGCDQSQVQRFLTARSVSEGRTSLLMSAFVKIPMQFVILLVGVLIFVFYVERSPVKFDVPLLFDKAEVAKLEASPKAAEFKGLKNEFFDAQLARALATDKFLHARRHGLPDDSALAAFRVQHARIVALRKKAHDLVRANNGSASYSDVNYIFPTFVTTEMPSGFIGLIIAAIFAAAMSSISAELNALATTSVMDFYRRHIRREAADEHYLRIGKLATGFWGIFACGVAYYAAQLGSLIEVVNKFGSFFYGSLLGVFVLGLGIKRATARGAFWGLLAGMAAVGVVSYTTSISFLWYNVVGCAVVVIVGMLLSLTEEQKKA